MHVRSMYQPQGATALVTDAPVLNQWLVRTTTADFRYKIDTLADDAGRQSFAAQ